MIRTQPEGEELAYTVPAGGTSSSSSANTPGATTITILQGASTQGNPNFELWSGKVPLGNKVYSAEDSPTYRYFWDWAKLIRNQARYLTQKLLTMGKALLHKS